MRELEKTFDREINLKLNFKRVKHFHFLFIKNRFKLKKTNKSIIKLKNEVRFGNFSTVTLLNSKLIEFPSSRRITII